LSDSIDLNQLQDRAAALVEAARRAGADSSDAVVATSRSTGVDVLDGKVEESEGAENNAFSLRVFVGQSSASVSANMTGDLTQLAERAVAMAKVSPEDPHAGLAAEGRLATRIADLDLMDDTQLDFTEMRERAVACEEAALAVNGVTKSSGSSFGQTLGGTVLATSHGFVGSYGASRFSLSTSAVAGESTAMERDYDFDSQRHLADLRAASEIGALAGKRAVARINPQQVDTQSAIVVFEPRMARSLVSHFAGAVNASSIVRKTSFLKDSLNEQVFAPGVHIVDEPQIPRATASRPFDAEGVSAETLSLIDEGILKHWLLDSSTARALDLSTNGRANRAGSGTAPGSTNLTLEAGQTATKDLISSIQSGFYVTELIGQGVNLISGDYSRGASGFWIENGELTYAVSEVTIAGNLREMFSHLQPGDDLEKRHGTNAPTVTIEGMTIAGR